MEIRFLVLIAASLNGFSARSVRPLDWLDPSHQEDHDYAAFFAGVDAFVHLRHGPAR